MTNITTNDPGRTLPPKLAEFGESLLRIADRAREVQGLEPFGEDMLSLIHISEPTRLS